MHLFMYLHDNFMTLLAGGQSTKTRLTCSVMDA